MIYRNEMHQFLFEEAIRSRDRHDNELMAAIYLLTSHRRLWQLVRLHIVRNDIRFDEVTLPEMTMDHYTIYRTAMNLYSYTDDSPYLSIRDLTDTNLIPNVIYQLIFNAIAIRRLGLAALKGLWGVVI